MFNLGVNSAKSQTGMTLASVNDSDAPEKVKTRQIELFTKYNVNGNDTIDEEEFAAYKKDEKKSFWKKVAIGAVAVGVACVAGYLAYRGNAKAAQTLTTLNAPETAKATETVAEKAPTIRSKLDTLIIDAGNNTKWIKYTSKSKACSKWGLREVIKEYNPNGELSKLTYNFSTNPLLGYQRASGTPEQMRKLWKSVTQLNDKEAVENLLNFLS